MIYTLCINANRLFICPIWVSIEGVVVVLTLIILHATPRSLMSHQSPLECWALSLGNAPLKLPYILAYNSNWEFFSILEFGQYKFLNAHSFTLMTSSFCGWDAFSTPAPLTHTESRGPSHPWRH